MKVVALSGGVGGARLVQGLADVLQPGSLTVVANTGDDFDHWGLRICPDLDTLLYTLASEAPLERGWGLERESFEALEMVRRYGGDAWFALGDRDLGAHVFRTHQLALGVRLTAIADRMLRGLGVTGVTLLPMADAPKPTLIDTADGTLAFQDWLVRRRGAPPVTGVRWGGDPPATAEVLAALEAADVIVIAPSNPYVSVAPILGLPGVRERLSARPVVGVSPIVAGAAIKGPLAQMIPALAGRPASAAAVRDHYGDLLDGFVIERGDDASGVVLHTSTVMGDREDRARLAREVLAFAEAL